jgi:hypothetical protein
MLFAAFTGGFLGMVLGWARIDTRYLTYNVFYREKTFLRQSFFHGCAGASSVLKDAPASEPRILLEAIPLFEGMR